MNNQKSTEHFKEGDTLEKEHAENVTQENTDSTSAGAIAGAEVVKDQHTTDGVQEEVESPVVADIENDRDGTKYSKSVSYSISMSTSDSDDNDDDESGGEEGISSSTSNKILDENKEKKIEEFIVNKSFEENNECRETSTPEDSAEVSRKGSANTNDGLDKSPKKKRILKKLKIQNYWNKGYNRVSNAIIKTSKSIMKSNTTTDKSEKKGNQKSAELLNTLNSDELLQDREDCRLSDEELTSINKYFDTKTNVIECNKETLNTINLCLQNNDSERLLNEVIDLLNERKLLIKALNHFLNQNTDYKISLEKYKDAVDILTAEKEQLCENAKTLKSCIDTLHDNEKINNTILTDNDRMTDKMFTELTSKVEG